MWPPPDRRFWDFPLFPDKGSNWASPVDHLMYFLFGVSTILAFIVFFLIIFFVIRYHYKTKVNRVNPPMMNLPLELIWTGIPFGLLMIMFVWGSDLYVNMHAPPADAIEMYVVGKQWMWKIQHPEGQREINTLHIPVGRAVKLVMTSQDVIHDFFIPDFRIKQDVLPGRYTQEWFMAVKPGTYDFFCAQYCGTSHSGMIGRVIAMRPMEYARWLQGTTDGTMANRGERLYHLYGCASCHRTDHLRRAPVFEGLYGKTVRLRGGVLVTADEQYLRESLIDPAAKIVEGYDNIMPTFKNQLSEEDILQLIAYIKSLKGPS